MCKLYAIFLSLLVFFQSGFAFSATQTKDVELHNLRWDWQSHHPEINQLVPFFGYSKTSVIHFDVGLNKYRSSYLKFILQENTFCWINDQLIFRNGNNQPLYLSIDSLKQVYKQNQLSFTLYNSDLDEQLISTTVVNRNQTGSIIKQEELQLRVGLGQSDPFIMISVIILLLIAAFRTAHYRLFREYFSVNKALQQRQSFELITAYSPLAWPNIGFILFYAVLIGCSVTNIGLFHAGDTFELPFELSRNNSLIIGLKICALCFVLMLLKLVLISASAALFKINKIRLIHFFTYFRHSLIIAIAIFIFSLINGIFEGSMVSEGWTFIQVLVVIVWSGRVIQIFFVLNKIYTFRKLHLFSYLCSTELIPLLLFFKIFLK